MGKAIRIHLGNGKNTYCGIVINKSLSIATKGELFFESEGKTIRFNCLCKNCVSIMVKKSKIYRNYIERVKVNESIIDYENKLPKSIRAMKLYCKKRQLNWNSANTKSADKLQLQVKSNPVSTVQLIADVDKAIEKADSVIAKTRTILNQYVNTGNQSIEEVAITDEVIDLTPEMEVVNPIAIGEKTEKGIKRELRKSGVLPYIKKVDKTINRIQNDHPIAMVRGFGNNWKVIEEFSSMGNCNSANVKELTGWVPITIAQKVYNQYVINRVME